MKSFYIIILFVYFCTTSCFQERHRIIIKGEISNLPDGILYLYKDIPENRIDSTSTKNGKFNLVHQWKENDEPVYLGLDHVDKKKVTRAFSFPANAKFKGSTCNPQYFFSDSIISINGRINDFLLKDFEFSEKYKIVTSPKLIAGKQTRAFYNIDCDLFENIGQATEKKVNIIENKIKTYPYSYHLLYKIAENKNAFSPEQIDEFLKLFKDEITESKTFKNLSEYNKKRYHEKNASLPLLENVEGEKSAILNSKYKKHLVIFWASWCGPCRKEIPLLKKMYSTKDESLEFISISIDQDNIEWKKALNEEKMDWAQFITNEKDLNYEKIQMHFRLNSAIPYTVLIDNNYKILKYNVGLSSEQELYNFINKK